MTLTDTAIDARGLTSDEAARLSAERGPNEAATEQDDLFHRIVRHFWAPVPWMLEIAVIIQIAMKEYVAAGLIAAVLVFNVLLGTFQESRAKAALELLKQSLPLKARVRRDGKWTDVLARVLVPGDIVQLSLGTVVPADIKIVSGSILVDQSMLTGESVPIEAVAGTVTYAGAQVRRGEAIGLVTATGATTYFGRAAELVRVAHFESSEEKAVFGLVRNLTFLNAAILIWLVTYALVLRLPPSQIILLVLTALISAVPVALPATFTLAAALGSRVLAAKGVLLARLTALNEAATIDVLCADKTGTLTSNELGVALVRPLAEGWSEGDILAFAALASSSDGRDSVDMAIQRAAQAAAPSTRPLPRVLNFTPFDPTTKQAEAKAVDASAREIVITKGAPEKLGSSTETSAAELLKLATAGYRTLAVAVGPAGQALLVGFVALSDSPRPDSAALLKELGSLGVHTVMLTGDTMATAMTVARAIGLEGAACPAGKIPDRVVPDDFAVYAGIFPEDKFRLVRAFQNAGHAVGMCGDGANDAPALRQAQMGIAVSSATDVAKAAAGMVLTTPGLGGIVSAITEGRIVFRRVLTYTFTILINKTATLLVLGGGLLLTGHAVLTPMLQAISMFANDFASTARTTDNATPSPHPNAWRLRNLTLAAIPLAAFKLLYLIGVLTIAVFRIGLSTGQIQSLTFIMLVFAGQGVMYVVRERGRLWSSCPSRLMIIFSITDIVFVSALAIFGIFIQPLPASIVVTLLAATVVFVLALDQVKVMLYRYFPID
jgi:H+-transporting ATPase